MRTPGARGRHAARVFGLVTAHFCGALFGCEPEAPQVSPPAATSASAGPMGLSPEAAAKVLARVGDQVITLGDYAATLERMDRFERLRYQTDDRRRQLLQEMIDVELLAQEAERRGLHQTPEAEELVRQVLRDELLAELRAKQPSLDQIPTSEIRAYYEAHRKDFREPERRRIAAVVTRNEKTAQKVLAAARGADAKAFGELVKKHSVGAAELSPEMPAELAGDLGFVTPPGDGEADNAKVPEPVRAAAFQIAGQGQLLDRVVEADKQFYVIRLVTVNAARDRSLKEAERTIRVALLRQRIRDAEAALEAELRKKFTVTVDEAALARVKVPPREGNP